MYGFDFFLFSNPVLYDYNITDPDMIADADHTILTFPAGTPHGEIMNVSIAIWDDLFVEDMETIVLYAYTQPELSASFVPGQNTVTLSILDDDGM